MRIFCQRKVANATRTFAFKIKSMHENSIVTITILICLFAFVRFSEVKADCPVDSTCNYQYVESDTVTIEYPSGSGCILKFTYCHRRDCHYVDEVHINFISYATTFDCLPPESDSSLYMVCLDSVILHNWSTDIPHCNEGYEYKSYSYHASCLVWYPSKIECEGDYVAVTEYKPYVCNQRSSCSYTVSYCWTGEGPDFVLQTETHFGGPIYVPSVPHDPCENGGISFLNTSLSSETIPCVREMIDTMRTEINSFLENNNHIYQQLPDDKKEQYLNNYIDEQTRYNPHFLDEFFDRLKNCMQQEGNNNSIKCNSSFMNYLDLIKNRIISDYPGGWFYCRTSCEFDK